MEFEFDKFVNDIEKRNIKEQGRKTHSQQVIDLDIARRLRDKNYFERWQNRIVWEKTYEK
jgi:hypothetical protein